MLHINRLVKLPKPQEQLHVKSKKHINGEIQYPFKTFNRSFRWADKPMTVARKQIHRPNAKAVELYDKSGKIPWPLAEHTGRGGGYRAAQGHDIQASTGRDKESVLARGDCGV